MSEIPKDVMEAARLSYFQYVDTVPRLASDISEDEVLHVAGLAIMSERKRCANIARDIRKRLEAGRTTKRPLPQVEEYGAGIGDIIADRIEALK